MQALEESLRECESQLQKRNGDKSQLTSKLAQLKRSYEEARAGEEQRGKEVSSLEQVNQHANSRLAEMKAKLEVERRSLEQMGEEFESKYSLLLHEKSTLQNEVEEYRWEADRSKAAVTELNSALKQAQQEAYLLSQEIIQTRERGKKEEEERVALQLSHDSQTNKIVQLERRGREGQAQIKDLQQQVAQLSKALNQQEHAVSDAR